MNSNSCCVQISGSAISLVFFFKLMLMNHTYIDSDVFEHTAELL